MIKKIQAMYYALFPRWRAYVWDVNYPNSWRLEKRCFWSWIFQDHIHVNHPDDVKQHIYRFIVDDQARKIRLKEEKIQKKLAKKRKIYV